MFMDIFVYFSKKYALHSGGLKSVKYYLST